MSKHYVRVQENTDIIVHGFSDDFETPLDTDICINDNGERQFSLLGEINPPLVNSEGAHLYRLNTYVTEEQVEVVEDATDEIEVEVDTSDVKLDDEEAVLTEVEVNNNITATAKGTKTILRYSYEVRYATAEEIAEELEGIEVVTPESDSEKIKELQEQVQILQDQIQMQQEQSEMLIECILELSSAVYASSIRAE